MYQSSESEPRLTDLIQLAANANDAREQLYQRVYDDLRAAARRVLPEHPKGDLQTTALVHEVFLRFEKSEALTCMTNRRVFFAVAIRAMNQVLIDHYRRRTRNVDSPNRASQILDDAVAWLEEKTGFEFERLHLALQELERSAPRQHLVIMHRFFGGLTVAETAELLDISDKTVERDGRLARAKLLHYLKPELE